MTPPSDLVECANCDGFFTAASSDDVFYHATCRCSREPAGSSAPRFSSRDTRGTEFPSVRLD